MVWPPLLHQLLDAFGHEFQFTILASFNGLKFTNQSQPTYRFVSSSPRIHKLTYKEIWRSPNIAYKKWAGS